MIQAIILTIILSLGLTSVTFAGQEMMKRQEPTMGPVMRTVPMMKKAPASTSTVKKSAKKSRKTKRKVRKSM